MLSTSLAACPKPSLEARHVQSSRLRCTTVTAAVAPGSYRVHRKLVVPEKLEPASVAEILKGMGYGGSGVVLKYGKEASLPFPRHSHNTPAVELVMGGVFKFTFNDGLEETLHPGDAVEFGAGTQHHFLATGSGIALAFVPQSRSMEEVKLTFPSEQPDPEMMANFAPSPFPAAPVHA